MSIAMEAKMERLLKRMDDQEAELIELRAKVKKLEDKENARAAAPKK